MILSFPSASELRPQLDKLNASKGSVILVAIEQDRFGFANVTWGWFSAEERAKLRKALSKAKKKREQGSMENPATEGKA